jgi:2-keto-4-pentenoate hydratase
MSHDNVETLARELQSAYEAGQMVEVPLSERPSFDLNTAYEVETRLKQFREAGGHRAVGRKVGYANKAMWRVLKLETLVWAHMYDDTVHYSDNNLATLPLQHTRSLKVEPEIVFGLKEPVTGERQDAAGALASVDWLALGFEIIDCPFREWKFQPSDFVASFGLHAALVIGERLQVRPDLIAKLVDELPRFKVRVSKNGEFAEEGSGRNSLKSPALCLAELGMAVAKRFPAEPLSSGEIVSSGTLTAGHPTAKGDLWTVEVEGLSLPSLTLRLT